MSTLFSQLLASATLGTGTSSVNVPDDWGMGRTSFGGLQAAVALQAMRTLVPAEVPLRTLQVTFIAPVPVGCVQAQAKVLRTGKNATQVEARITEGDQTLAVVIGVFGTARPSAVTVEPKQPAVESAKPIELPFVPGITPNFTQHFAARWLRGLPPFTGDTETRHVVELGMKDSGSVTECHVLAFADYIPPVALSLLRKPARAGSMTWMIEFLTDRFEGLVLNGWRIDAELVAGRDGYTSQSVMVWGPGGIPVAISRQSMVVFG